MEKKIIITGCIGFIGFHLCKNLLNKNNIKILGIDNVNQYYSIKLKKDRLKILKEISKINKNFIFKKVSISNKNTMSNIFKFFQPDLVINLAAQAGVRHSLKYPEKYLRDNIKGFLNILELSKLYNVKKVIYASSSSIYGRNESPFQEKNNTDKQIQFYAVTKKTNELMAHTWSSLYGIQTIGLRFFTVYGPWGRPDMALYKFVTNICNDKTIELFNNGDHVRDFTYIDDIVNGITSAIKFNIRDYHNKNLKILNKVPSIVVNLGSGRNITLMNFLKVIERDLNKKAIVKYLPMQKGDIHTSLADLTLAKKLFNYRPKTKPEEGIKKFINWYKSYNKI